jgi:pimeloyl-ACP methyl ester carboxylesterase
MALRFSSNHTRLSLALLAAFSMLSACGGGGSDSPNPHELAITTHQIPSSAKAAMTPGTPGVTVATGSKLATQFGTTNVDLNNIRYTRYGLKSSQDRPVDAVLVAIPGTLAASHSYLILAENLIQRIWDEQRKVVEVWGVDRRSVQLQDMSGLDIAEKARDARLALDFLFGGELGLPLDARLKRRAVFHDSTDVAFMAHWTPQVHSQDIDAVIDKALAVARNGNVFLAGHSAGTGFAARYAATDFNLSGTGTPKPGFAKLKGLVLFEGAGASLSAAPTSAQLDAVIAAAEGGLYQAVASGSESAFVSRPGLTPRVSASTEIAGMQITFEDTINGTQALLQADQGGMVGNNAYAKVADFTPRAFKVTAGAALGTFMDDDNLDRTVFYSVSMGYLGDVRSSDGLRTWLDNNDKLPAAAFRDFGPQPTTMSAATPPWGKEVEPTNLKRFSRALFLGGTTYSDWYYPSSGLLLGNAAGAGGANLGLDTSALSLPVSQGGRGRPDIVNQTQARRIDIPVIAFGGTNGLTPVAGIWRGFAEAIAPCAAPSCKAGTARTPAGQSTLVADRKYGGVEGGFEVHLSEGYSHVDVLTADDDSTNNVVRPLVAFLGRNLR